ncbi:MAG: hypothetical protein CMJ18_10170 [Phycisphaeraceae bacterium]|nr:hypothetical protein [Phycisphaeraceae bacterium]
MKRLMSSLVVVLGVASMANAAVLYEDLFNGSTLSADWNQLGGASLATVSGGKLTLDGNDFISTLSAGGQGWQPDTMIQGDGFILNLELEGLQLTGNRSVRFELNRFDGGVGIWRQFSEVRGATLHSADGPPFEFTIFEVTDPEVDAVNDYNVHIYDDHTEFYANGVLVEGNWKRIERLDTLWFPRLFIGEQISSASGILDTFRVRDDKNVLPEPASLSLLLLGGLISLRRRRN